MNHLSFPGQLVARSLRVGLTELVTAPYRSTPGMTVTPGADNR